MPPSPSCIPLCGASSSLLWRWSLIMQKVKITIIITTCKIRTVPETNKQYCGALASCTFSHSNIYIDQWWQEMLSEVFPFVASHKYFYDSEKCISHILQHPISLIPSFASLFRHLTLNVDWLLASASVARDAIRDFLSRGSNTINDIFRCFAHDRQPPPCPLSLWHMSLPTSKYKKILYVNANWRGSRVKELMYDGIKFYGRQFSRSLGSCVELKQKWAALKLSNFSAVSPSAEP